MHSVDWQPHRMFYHAGSALVVCSVAICERPVINAAPRWLTACIRALVPHAYYCCTDPTTRGTRTGASPRQQAHAALALTQLQGVLSRVVHAAATTTTSNSQSQAAVVTKEHAELLWVPHAQIFAVTVQLTRAQQAAYAALLATPEANLLRTAG